MGEIAFLKGTNLYMKAMVHMLNEELEEYTFHYWDINDLMANHPLDLVILDLSSNYNIEKLRTLVNTKIAIWSFSRIDNKKLIELMQLEIDGYIYGAVDLEQMKIALQSLLAGNKYIHPYFANDILEEYKRVMDTSCCRPDGLLTCREWEVMELIAKGYQNDEIANLLSISDKTVKNHVASILRKLQVRDRTSAVITSIRNNWVKVY